MHKLVMAFVAAGSLLGAAPLAAQQAVALHGYGQWLYGRTDGNNHLGGSEDGNYEDLRFALVAHATVSDRLRINSLIEWDQGPEGAALALELGFAEWSFSDAVRLRAGKSRLPFGLYTETLEVGTLRPFFWLPQGVYGRSGLITKSYDGASLNGEVYGASGWGLSYDVYGGTMLFFGEGGGNAGAFFEEEEEGEEEEEEGDAFTVREPVDDLIGGRFVVTTPVTGLRFGVSANTGISRRENNARHSTYGGNLEYLSGPWHFRAEAYRHTEEDEFRLNVFYGEGAFAITPRWQVAARYDFADMTITEDDVDIDEAPSLLEHREGAFGLNYWFDTGFVIKSAVHFTSGNLFAGPELGELDEAIEAGALERETVLFTIGAQFSF